LFIANMSKNLLDCGLRICYCGLKSEIVNPNSEIKI
jgi:hypothetical protein